MKKLALIIMLILAVIFVCPAYISGDVDHSGTVTATDEYIVVGYVLGECALDDSQMTAADVNRDGRVTSSDLTIISRIK